MNTQTNIFNDNLAGEIEAQLGLRTINPYDGVVYDPAYIELDREWSFIDNQLMDANITVKKEDEKLRIYMAGEPVKMVSRGNRIEVSINGTKVRYGKVLDIIAKTIYIHGKQLKEIDGQRYYGFVVEWNQVHLMLWYSKERNHVGIKKWSKDLLTNSYYRKLGEFRIINSTRGSGEVETSNEIYGEHATGLGSRWLEPMSDQLDEAMELIESLKGVPEFKEKIEEFAQALLD